MKSEILKLLKEAGGFVSGQELCERFGVSRTAVWKAVKQLEQEGIPIEAVRNKGYRLSGDHDVLSGPELESSIKGRWAGRYLAFYDTVDSTNTRAKHLAEEEKPHGTLVVADTQTGGKGRRGRAWTSPSGSGIWMSLILRPEILPSSASMLTLVAALAVQEGIKDACGLTTSIKWPNDIVADGKKLCGILTEMSAELEAVHYVVTGIGINANMEESDFPEELRKTATSLRIETGKTVRRSKVVTCVMAAMEKYYDQFVEDGNLSRLTETYNSRMVNLDREVRVLDPKGEYTGKALGIDDEGQLLVEMKDGGVRLVVSGEVSVRGVYGYV